jgi:hypothetical protein
MSRNAILTRIKLTANHSVFAERPTDFLADLADCAVGVELLADGAGG